MIFSAGEGAGESGSFFFFSKDNRFLIKTLKGGEKDIVLGFLKNYVDHIKNTKNNSLIARIYGLYTIKCSLYEPLDIIVM
jgi:1-phosphatidylinositol-4-phosphate 5-kinase